MAADDDDPYVKAGRAVTSGKAPTVPTADDDPYVKLGRTITSAPALAADVPTSPPEAPDWTWRGLGREAAGAVLRTGANVANVLSDPYANLVGRPAITAWQTAHDFAAPLLGGDRYTPEQRNQLYADFADQPGTRAIQSVGQAVGADPYNIQGSTPTERLAGAVLEGAGTAGAMAGNIPGLIMGGAGALGGEIAADYAPDWLKPGASLAGNIVGAKVGQTAANLGTRVIGAVRGQTTPVAAAYDELGIDKTLLGDVSESPGARLVQAYGSKSPFGSGTVNPIERKVVGQFNQAVETTASRLGKSTSEQTAGEVLQSEARNWRDVVFPQRQATAWAPVDQMLGGETVVPGNYRAALTSLTSKLAAMPETAKALVPQKAWDMLAAINKDAPPGQSIPWQQAQSLRSALGQVMGIPEIVQSVGKDQLTRAYGGISQDMRDAAASVDARNVAAAHASGTAVPPSAVDAFTNANKVSTEGHAFIEGTLSKIVRSNNPAQETIAPERAARSVLGSGDTTLEALRREMPAATDDLAAFKLRDMALATPGAAGRTGTETSVGSFLTDLNRLRQQSPAGFRALFADPEVARKIDAMATVADTMKETAKRANTSGTGPYMALGEAVPTAVATWLATNSPTATIGSVFAPYAANRTAASVATSPALSRIASAPGPRVLPNPLLTGALLNMQRRDNNPLVQP